MTYEEFIEKLKSYSVGEHWIIKWGSSLRRKKKDSPRFEQCPITFVYFKETGLKIEDYRFHDAANKLGIDRNLAENIAIAADYSFISPKMDHQTTQIRLDLYKALNVE